MQCGVSMCFSTYGCYGRSDLNSAEIVIADQYLYVIIVTQNKRKTESATSLHTSPSKTTATGTGTRNRTSDGPSLDTITGASATSSATVRSASAPLDCTNPAFDEWLRRRREFRKDRLAEQRVSCEQCDFDGDRHNII